MDEITEKQMMQHCIHLSSTAPRQELPIACVICDGHNIVAEGTNEVKRNSDVTRHAEVVAIARAQKFLKRKNLSHCTLYTTVEPCPICSFAIRETQISRVIYAMSSPLMGGMSKWNILRDTELSDVIPEIFGPVPEVVGNVLWKEAAEVWSQWNPIAWQIIKYRQCFGPEPINDGNNYFPPIASSANWLKQLMLAAFQRSQ